MTNQNAFVEHFRDLSRHFADQLPKLMEQAECLWAQGCQTNWNEETSEKLRQLAHSLAGSSASMGFTRIGEAARALDDGLQDFMSQKPVRNAQEASLRIASYMDNLRHAFRSDKQNGATNIERQLTTVWTATPSLHDMRSDRLIYLVEDDVLQACELASQISYFGYTVQTFIRLSDLQEAIRHTMPTAVLMDIIFPEGDLAGTEAMAELQRTLPEPLPVIFISVSEHIRARLQAVHAGGKAYFVKPVDIVALIDALDRLICSAPPIPYRILIVDDSRVHAQFNALQLKKAGMKTEIVSDPLHLLASLEDFNPDLILLDMYMPDCTGMDLAKVIRQMEEFVSVPIVYLSGETDKDKQLEAMGHGADDFLTKPIEPSHLIAAVTSRVERYRKLRSLMSRDGLTGLLNHTTTKDRLCQEISKAQRQDSPLSLAMIDLDDFKSVNDLYGHAMGDRVLKTLAHLLSRRLRSSDTIGRYGGEEFAVLLPHTCGDTAVRLMEEIRAGFARIRHRAGDQEFSVTFSCGIATFPEHDSPTSLSAAADKALYAAKRQGRNRVVPAETV